MKHQNYIMIYKKQTEKLKFLIAKDIQNILICFIKK